MSAELNALIKFYDGQYPLSVVRDYHLLLCTDTWLGEAAAHLVATWLRQHGCNNVEVRRQKDLQTAQINAFQLALSDLIQWCEETLPVYRAAQYHIVFNLTGGFKSVQGFLQTLAMFYADEVVYIFESGTALLHIPRLPIRMDAEDTVRNHLTTFRRLAYDLQVEDVSGIPETMLLRIEQQVTFSPGGNLSGSEPRSTYMLMRFIPRPRLSWHLVPVLAIVSLGFPPIAGASSTSALMTWHVVLKLALIWLHWISSRSAATRSRLQRTNAMPGLMATHVGCLVTLRESFCAGSAGSRVTLRLARWSGSSSYTTSSSEPAKKLATRARKGKVRETISVSGAIAYSATSPRGIACPDNA